MKVPVISVQKQVDKDIKDVVLGLDLLDEHYSVKAFKMVKALTESLNARLHIVNIVNKEMPENLMSDLNKMAKIGGLENFIVDVIEAKNENKALMDYAEDVNAGLIISLSDARSGLFRFFQHSFSTKLTKKSEIPVLTINKGHLQ